MRQYIFPLGVILASTPIGAGCASSPESPPAKAEHPKDHGGEHGHKEGHAGHEGAYKHEGGHHRFDNPEQWAKRFETKERDEWQKPDVVLAALGLGDAPTKVVADIGSATGYFPVRIAPSAKMVYGVDIEPTMVDYLNARAAREGIANLKSIVGTTTSPNLPEPLDVGLVVNTYHHIENRTAYFEKVVMNPGGRLVIVDFRPDGASDFGPPPAMRLAPDVVERELKAAGFSLVATDSTSLPYQYLMTFEK